MARLGETYGDVLHALYALEARRGMDLTLGRTRDTLKHLGDPQKRFASVHIAGTNGKGSVAAMLHAMAIAADLKTGLYTSPHLVNFTERIRIGTAEVDEATIVSLANEVFEVASRHAIDLTFFEITTVMALLHFARAQVDLAVLETGLGGRFDATNVVDPLVTVITSIGFDHEEFLGTDLAAITFEKCGIIKDECPLVTPDLGPEAMAVVRQTVARRRAPWVAVGELPFDGPLALRGSHQRTNARLAVEAAALLPAPLHIPQAAVHRGLQEAYWPGRLDVIGSQPMILIDGAHNPAGVEQLCAQLPELTCGRDVFLLFSVMHDKKWRAMVQALSPHVSSATVTRASPLRAADPTEVVQLFRDCGCRADVDEDPARAFRRLRDEVPRSAVLLVAGSLFLAGAVYRELLRDCGATHLFGASPALHPLLR